MEYKIKTPSEQKKDLELLEFMRRFNPEQYFYDLISYNKLGITDTKPLTDAERSISGYKAALVSREVKGNLDFVHLKEIHKFMFGDIYYFAGEPRKMNMEIDSVTVFCPANKIEREAARIFDGIKENNYLKGLNKDKFIEKFADYLTDVNILHPFREGNGRSKRVFFTELAHQAGYEFNYNKVSSKEWLLADEIAFDTTKDSSQIRDTTYLKMLLNKAIIPIFASNAFHELETPLRSVAFPSGDHIQGDVVRLKFPTDDRQPEIPKKIKEFRIEDIKYSRGQDSSLLITAISDKILQQNIMLKKFIKVAQAHKNS